MAQQGTPFVYKAAYSRHQSQECGAISENSIVNVRVIQFAEQKWYPVGSQRAQSNFVEIDVTTTKRSFATLFRCPIKIVEISTLNRRRTSKCHRRIDVDF